MCGEFTIEMIKTGKYECKFNGKPEVIEQIIFAKDKKIATKIFMDYLRAADRAVRWNKKGREKESR